MMAGARQGEPRDENLDWEKLQGPVPMDLIDPEFPAHPPGAASEILPRGESDGLAREAAVEPPAAGASGEGPGPFDPGPSPDADATLAGGTTQFGADDLVDEFARIRAEMEAEAEAEKLKKQEAEKEEAEQRQRLEQWMANARARLLKADADLAGPAGRVRIRKESSPSLYRLAEMQKTMAMDGDATVPDGSRAMAAQTPSLDPMATISVPAEQFLGPETHAPFAPPLSRLEGIRQHTGQAPATPPAPPAGTGTWPAAMPPAAPAIPETARFQSGPIPFAPPAPGLSVPAAGSAPMAPAAPDAFRQPPPAPSAETPYPSGPLPLVTAASGPRGNPPSAVASDNGLGLESSEEEGSGTTMFRPMTREEALTRKVAKLRKVAEAGENTLALAPPGSGDGESRALNFAIAAVVLIGILVLGLGLFAATQAGLFDGLENRIPFLKPKIALPLPAAPADPAAPGTDRPSAPAPSASGGPVSPAPAPRSEAALEASAMPAAPPASAPVAAAAPASSKAAPKPPAPRNAPAAGRPAARNPTAGSDLGQAQRGGKAPRPAPKAAKRPAAPAAPAAQAAEDGDIPAYARARSKSSGQAETLLRSSVQAAASMGKGDLLDLYNRYALGYPGLSGEVVIGLTVDPSGRILEGSVVSSTTGVEAFDQDLLRKVMDWRLGAFPESRPKFVSVPFLFPMQGH